MDGQFQRFGESSAAARQSSHFAAEIEQLIGERADLDPLFLEECWTVGAAGAMENWRSREQNRVAREHQNRAFRELDSFAFHVNFVEASEPAADSLLADRAAAIASRYNENWSQRQDTSAPDQHAQGWTPQDWIPQDQIAHRWIPQGWMPDGLPQIESQQPEAFAAASKPLAATPEIFIAWPEPMSESRARLLLETAPTSTREQLRSAYRRMVSRWHPDHLQLSSEEVRQYATQQMATINEAYSLLRAALDLRAAPLEDAA